MMRLKGDGGKRERERENDRTRGSDPQIDQGRDR